MKAVFSCVMDRQEKFARQALIWAYSLLTYGQQRAGSLVIHAVGGCRPEYQRIFDSLGIVTCTVEPFDPRHPPSNKLAQLESKHLAGAEYLVLCDCDLAFCGSIAAWIEGDSVRARVAARPGLSPARWAELFGFAGLELPAERATALLENSETLPAYCNGGLLILPQHAFSKLRDVWPKWDRWVLDRWGHVRPYKSYADQISFALSCAELGLCVDHLPVELNFPALIGRGRRLRATTGLNRFQPVVLHYHRLDRLGFLPASRIDSVNREVMKINRLIRRVTTPGPAVAPPLAVTGHDLNRAADVTQGGPAGR